VSLQYGDQEYAHITQAGNLNTYRATQGIAGPVFDDTSAGNSVVGVQTGTSNMAVVHQAGTQNHITTSQVGVLNTLNINQVENYSEIRVVQNGAGNQATIVQRTQ
jgi:hypothetical protein